MLAVMKRYLLEIVVFITGAVVMIMELVGTRILAPYVGSSIIVWTSLIGIILGSLSLGYAFGGKLADKNPSYKVLSTIIFLATIYIALLALFKEVVLSTVSGASFDLRFTSVASSLVLFAPPSLLLGMVVPYTVKLRLKSLAKTGRISGNLYAFSTVGSIIGTFAAGFFLIAYLGNTKILVLLSFLLLVAGYLCLLADQKENKLSLFLLFSLILLAWFLALPAKGQLGFVDTDTAYSRVLLQKTEIDGRPALTMHTGLWGTQSAMFLDSDELALEYTKYYRLSDHFNPSISKALAIGGGGYSYPKDFLKRNPDASLDVVEIDPGVTELARKYFNLKPDPRLFISHADGRVFLNKAKSTYDAIYIDAYQSDLSIPYQLTTIESVQKMHQSLNEGGVVIVNIISAINGPAGKFLRAELATYKEVFPQVYIFPVSYVNFPDEVQNIALVALKSEKKPSFESEDEVLNEYLGHLWAKEVSADVEVLTDDYAPVDQYMLEVIRERQ